jgi:alpha-L-rhamnosidase
VTPSGLIAGGTQTSYVLALHFDLLPQNLRGMAVEELVRDIKKRGTHLSTGFVGSPTSRKSERQRAARCRL